MARKLKAKTVSEILFERFCTEVGIEYTPVPTESKTGTRTPDYDLTLGGIIVVAEVKQLDPNEEQLRMLRELKETGMTGGVSQPGKRIGQKISAAAGQLRKRAAGKWSALLVLYNNVGLPFAGFIDPYEIKTGMYGLEAVILKVPTVESGKPIVHVDQRFGGRRKVTPKDNTTLSAVAVLADVTPELTLWVYHNIHAARPLKPSLMRHPQIRHFELGAKAKGEPQKWVETTCP